MTDHNHNPIDAHAKPSVFPSSAGGHHYKCQGRCKTAKPRSAYDVIRTPIAAPRRDSVCRICRGTFRITSPAEHAAYLAGKEASEKAFWERVKVLLRDARKLRAITKAAGEVTYA